MPYSTILFFRKTYKLFSVVGFVVIFFVVYNTYLVDRSIINLRIALSGALQAQALEDFQKIKSLLKIPLQKEISKIDTSSETLISMEIIENVFTTAKSEEQIEDVKFLLRNIIIAKEKERGAFLSALDRLNSRIFAPIAGLSKEKLQAQVRTLLAKIESTKDKNMLQNLYYGLGNVYVQLSNLSKAEEAFQKTVQIDPQSTLSVKARFNLAWAYKSMGEYDKAEAEFERLSQEAPQIELAIASKYQVADTLYKKGNYLDARDKYALLADEYSQFESADLGLFQAGYISFYNLDDKEAALNYFSKLESGLPQADTAKYVRSKTRMAIAADFRHQGYSSLKEKKYIKAIDKFEKAVEIAPLDGRSVSGMGLGFYWLDRKPEALDKANKAVGLASIDEVTLINSLFIYINSGMIDEAIKIGEEVLSRTFIPRAEFYYNLGYAYVLKAKIDEASSQFERTLRINPDFIFAYNNLGCTFWLVKKYSEAIKKFKQAIDIDPGYADAHFNLGIAYFYLNRFEDAYKEFKTVLDINPGYSEAGVLLRTIIEILKYEP